MTLRPAGAVGKPLGLVTIAFVFMTCVTSEACEGEEFTSGQPVPDEGGAPSERDGANADDAADAIDAASGTDAKATACTGDHLRYDGPSDRCYRFNGTVYGWDAAESECVVWGGHLVALGSAAEHQLVTQFVTDELSVQTNPTVDGVWIGLKRLAGVWVWTTGDALAFQNWAPGDPEIDAEKNCVFEYGLAASTPGKWNNYKCGVEAYSICER